MKIRNCCIWVLAATSAQAGAGVTGTTNDGTTPQVVVNGEQSDLDKSRDFVAGKLVISKKTIADSGAQTAGEVLRREPAVSIDKDGRLGLMGLPGYTQLMIDGQPNTIIDWSTLDVSQIERIEIIKSATAATGPYGIAGTINIVRRQIERKAFTQLKAGVTSSHAKGGANLNLTSNQLPADSPLSYNYTLSASQRDTPARQSYVSQQYSGSREDNNRFTSLLASGDIEWKLAPAHKLTFSPELARFEATPDLSEARQWQSGESLRVRSGGTQPIDSYGLSTRWDWKIDADQRLMLNLKTAGLRSSRDRLQSYDYLLQGEHQRAHTEDGRNHNRFLTLDYKADFDGHDLNAGIKLIRNRNTTRYADSEDGAPDLSQAALGTSSAYRINSDQFFIQDDWRYDRTLSLQAGLSAEQRRYWLQDGVIGNQASFTVWSPSLHLAKKIGGDRKKQLRASLTRTFKAPEVSEMLLHPTINRLAPCAADRLCGANTIDTADRTGNPQLQPERALGLNLSYSHGFSDNSEAVLEAYARKISNKTGYELVLQDVPWASVPRYISRQTNLGDARIAGVNLEGRFTLQQFQFSGSVGVAHSSVSDLPGPDNHLAGQLPWRAKLGTTYTPKTLPLKLTLDANWLPADWVQENALERSYQSSKFTLDAGANWKISSQYRLILKVDNLLARNNRRIDQYADVLQRYSTVNTFTRTSLTLETSL